VRRFMRRQFVVMVGTISVEDNKVIIEVIRCGCGWSNLCIPPVILSPPMFTPFMYLMLNGTSCQMLTIYMHVTYSFVIVLTWNCSLI
jgi:hypothetical protein